MEEKKPKFADLTPEQVNDLIAEKVMGWVKKSRESYFTYWWCEGEDPIIQRYDNNFNEQANSKSFSPYTSLDDCWMAEERLKPYEFYTNPPGLWECYEQILVSMYLHPIGMWFGRALHAKSKEKCEAMLRAIGEVE